MNKMRELQISFGEDVKGGRKSKKAIVEEYYNYNPFPTVDGCISETGVSRATVFRYKPKKEK